MTFCPTGWFGRLFLKTPLPYQPYIGFEPGILLGGADTMNLATFGVDGIVRHTAGHTPGSISVELSSQDALVGDLISSGILLGGIALTGRGKRPPFEDDPLTVARELDYPAAERNTAGRPLKTCAQRYRGVAIPIKG
jgi:glyoxylase-like metal-dependent hydrolase (beta-lactamase superfamily II)